MVEGCLDHQHFRDCYHVHEKIRTRLSFCNRKLIDRIIRELHQTDDIMKQIPVWMDTARSCARTEADLGGRQAAELSGEKCSLHPQPESARHPYRDSPGDCRNKSPVLQLSHEAAGTELVQRGNGVYGLGIDRPEE